MNSPEHSTDSQPSDHFADTQGLEANIHPLQLHTTIAVAAAAAAAAAKGVSIALATCHTHRVGHVAGCSWLCQLHQWKEHP
jgi:hypothetical protein